MLVNVLGWVKFSVLMLLDIDVVCVCDFILEVFNVYLVMLDMFVLFV